MWWNIAVALVAASSGPSAPSADDLPTLVVLDLTSAGASELQTSAVSSAVVRGARELDAFAVLSSADVREMLAIERQRQLLGTDKPDTLGVLSRSLGAKHVISGTLAPMAKGLLLDLKLLDTADGKVLAQKSVTEPKLDGVVAAAQGLVQELLGALLQQESGHLLVRTVEEGAEVLIDDKLIAATPLPGPVKVPRGKHRLQVRKDGFITRSQTVQVQRGEVTVEDIAMVPSGDYAAAYRQRNQRMRLGAYIATGVAVGALGGALAFDQISTDRLYRTEFAPRAEVLTLQSRTTEPLDPNTFASTVQVACAERINQCRTDAGNLKSRISNQQLVSLGLVGAGLIAAGFATYFWVSGDDPNRYTQLVVSAAPSPEGGGLFGISGRF